MTDPDRPDLHLLEEGEPPADERLGCLGALGALGLAGYAMLILGIAGFGLVGIIGITYGVLFHDSTRGPSLASGIEAPPWKLEMLRQRGVFDPTATPALFHDHSELGDGSAGCAVFDGAVLRWDDWAEAGRVPIAGGVATLAEDEGSVRLVTGDQSLSCPFPNPEDAARFARLVGIEATLRASEQEP